MTYNPTAQQARFIAAGLCSDRHVTGRGVPGCGKTTTLENFARQVNPRLARYMVMGVYNRHTKIDLERRLPHLVGQIRSLDGFACVAVQKATGKNYRMWSPQFGKKRRKDINDYARLHWRLQQNHFDADQSKLLGVAKQMIALTMATLTDYDNLVLLQRMAEEFDVDIPVEGVDFVYSCVKAICDWTDADIMDNEKQGAGYEFEDLSWWLARHPEAMSHSEVELFVGDEMQDWTEAQWQMIRLALGKNGRLVATGDENQALYQFRGVRHDIVGKINRLTNAERHDMTDSFRNPTCILPFVQKFVSDHNCVEGVIEGELIHHDSEEFVHLPQVGAACIYPTNAGAVRAAYQLMRHHGPRVKVGVAGKEIGEELKGTIAAIQKQSKATWLTFPKALEEWNVERCKAIGIRYYQETAENMLATQYEKTTTLRYLYEGACSIGIDSYEALDTDIQKNFLGDKDLEKAPPMITTMTCHKSKGLEYPQVFMDMKDIKSVGGRSAGKRAQYANSIYVGLTRTTRTLGLQREAERGAF